MGEFPMFPLGMVLLPGGALPLQVFEPRYLQMFRELLERTDDPPEFGQVLITRGREAGGGDERALVATKARVVEMQATPDGRYLLTAVGVERLRVIEWLDDDPYPRAIVEPWADEPDATEALSPADHRTKLSELTGAVARLHHLAAELGEPSSELPELNDEAAVALYQLGTLAPIGAADRYRMLASSTLSGRFAALESAIDDAMAVLEFRRS